MDLDELARLSAAATPGPWHQYRITGEYVKAGNATVADVRYKNGAADAAFIVALVNDYRLRALPGEGETPRPEYPRGYSHRAKCSKTHPIPFPCDDGTPTEAARAYRAGEGEEPRAPQADRLTRGEWADPTTEDWIDHALAAEDDLTDAYHTGRDGPGGLNVGTVRAHVDAVRTALHALRSTPASASPGGATWGFISPETGDFIGVTEDGMRRRWSTPASASGLPSASAAAKLAAALNSWLAASGDDDQSADALVEPAREWLDAASGLPSRDALGEAWAEAEAALPEGWGLSVGPGYNGGFMAGASARGAQGGIGAGGTTPIAALRALATRLAALSGEETTP